MAPTLLKPGALSHPELPNATPDEYIYDYIKHKLQQSVSVENTFVNRVLVLEAKTASGKSLTIPPLCAALLSELGGKYANKKVICTQPRVLTAQSIPKEINGATYFKKYGNQGIVYNMGDNLGYQTGSFTEMGPKVRLSYATNGVLDLDLIKNSPEQIMRKYGIIIIDEAHERSLQFDRTMMSLKYLFMQNAGNNDLPFLIFMSATFEYMKYAKFFMCGMDNVVRVSGASFEIEERWPESDVSQYIPEAVKKVRECIDEELRKEIATHKVKGSKSASGSRIAEISSENRILVFLPGRGQYNKVIKGLKNWESPSKVLYQKTIDDIEIIEVLYMIDGINVEIYLEILPFDSAAVNRLSKSYLKIISGSKEDKSSPKIDMRFSTQVLIGNAVAETGLSLPDLQYVIDSGWSKGGEFNPRINLEKVVIDKPAAQSQITQRRGRVGRKKPGVFIPLYTKETFDSLQLNQLPDIVRDDPTSLILRYAALYNELEIGSANITPGNRMVDRMLDIPSAVAAEYSIRKLQTLGFLDHDGKITRTGRIASTITSLNLQEAATVLASIAWDICIDDMIVTMVMAKAMDGPPSSAIWGYSTTELRKLEKLASGAPNASGKVDKKAMMAAREKMKKKKPNITEWNEIIAEVFNMPDVEKKDAYYKYRLIFCDTFFDGLMVYKCMRKRFYNLLIEARRDDKKNSWIIREMKKFSSKLFVNYENFLEILTTYTRVLDDLASSGINVYYKKEKSFMFTALEAKPLFMDTLIPMKKCIHYGFGFNIAFLNKNTRKYEPWWSYVDEKEEMRKNYPDAKITSDNKLELSWSMFGDDNINWSKMQASYEYQPQAIIFRSLEIQSYDANTNNYPINITDVSVVSGF
jgi:HrpA-like RNA helicase